MYFEDDRQMKVSDLMIAFSMLQCVKIGGKIEVTLEVFCTV